MSGLDDYQFENKNRWRVMMWHRIAARLKREGKQPRNSVVLYLPGPQDLDRRIALRKGFMAYNLIGVDQDIENVKAVREAGGLCVHGDFAEVVANWSRNIPLDVLFGDFCAGLHDSTSKKVLDAIYVSPISSCAVIALNFQRGRDSWSNYLRECLVRPFTADVSIGEVSSPEGSTVLRRNGIDGDLKHRGRQFCFMFWMIPRCNGPKASDEYADSLLRRARPEFLSYQSGVYMDSVLLSWPLMPGCVKRTDLTVLRNDVLARQLAAVVAHRTMRKVG